MRLKLVMASITALLLATSAPSLAADKIELGGSFSLTDMHGHAGTAASYPGKPLLGFFGLTHCPAVIPTPLLALPPRPDILGDDANKAQALFITVDPERDTPAVLAGYMANFHPGVVGLTGSAAQTAAVTGAYHVYYGRVETPESDAGYLMDHTAAIYLMDTDGAFVEFFRHGADPAAIAAAIERLL